MPDNFLVFTGVFLATTPNILELLFGIFQIVFEVTQQNCMRGAGLISQTLDIVRR